MLVALAAWIVVPAVAAAGNDGLAARIAESARDRGFGVVVTGLEAVQYRLSPPKTGGSLDPAAQQSVAADASSVSPSSSASRDAGHPSPRPSAGPAPVPLQPPIAPLASPALPGEGVFVARVLVDGQPAVQTALLRPDAGHADIGSWGREVQMTPHVRSVRQNLGLLVDGARLSSRIGVDTQSTWGATLGGDAYVWRSGVGVTSSGDVVFAMGPALSARTLAVLLQRAGAARAMELDINPEWVSYMWYSNPSGGSSPLPHKLLDFARPANRYFTVNSRDFFAVYSR